jgi:hypothetical protein
MPNQTPYPDPFAGFADTASPSLAPPSHIRMEVPYGRLVVVMDLTPMGEFVRIVEIRAARDFLSPSQRVAASGYHDVEEFYKD